MPEIKTGNTQDVLASLRGIGLHTWADRTAALPTRFDALLREAAELVLPDPVFYRVRGATISSPAELDAWLDTVRKQVSDALTSANGAPVVVS